MYWGKKLRFAFVVFFLSVFVSGSPDSLRHGKPAEAGMCSDHLSRLDSIISEALERKDFPGGVLLVARRGIVVVRKAYGDFQWIPESLPMETSHIFDIASLTKPIATATSVMILVERGKISLWDKVSDTIPEFEPDIRIWHLLTHTSGLAPFLETPEAIEACGSPCALKSFVGYIARMERISEPGESFIYSDIGYIILGYIIEVISGQPLDEFVEENLFEPLGMEHTFFTPQEQFIPNCVPTEVIDGKPLQGIVHDPRARLLSGVAGHAGLFSTVDDMAVFAQMMLDNGEYKGRRILSPVTVKRLASVYPRAAFAGRGIGWDIHSSYASAGGDLFGPRSYGHSGYTGTSMWIDPDLETFVIFLTNRVHPDDTGLIISLRSRLANVVAASITDFTPLNENERP